MNHLCCTRQSLYPRNICSRLNFSDFLLILFLILHLQEHFVSPCWSLKGACLSLFCSQKFANFATTTLMVKEFDFFWLDFVDSIMY